MHLSSYGACHPGHAHGSRRATFWPGLPAARTQKSANGAPPRSGTTSGARVAYLRVAAAAQVGWAWELSHQPARHLKRPCTPSGGLSSRPCHDGCNVTFPNRSFGAYNHTYLQCRGRCVAWPLDPRVPLSTPTTTRARTQRVEWLWPWGSHLGA